MNGIVQRFHSIGPRIAASVIVLILMTVGLVGWFGYAQQRDLNALLIDTRLKDLSTRVRGALKGRETQTLTLNYAIANTLGFAEHLDRNDRAWMLETLMPVFLAARDQGLDSLNAHRSPGINVLRWHNPSVFGDSIAERRRSVMAALNSGRPQAGLERGLGSGSLGLFASVPVRIGNRIVGVIDGGSYIDQDFADDLKTRLGIDVGFHILRDDAFDTIASTIPGISLLSVEERRLAMTG